MAFPLSAANCQGTLPTASCAHTCAEGFEGGSVTCGRSLTGPGWEWKLEPCSDIDGCLEASQDPEFVLAGDQGGCGTDSAGTTATASCSDVPAGERGDYQCVCDEVTGYSGRTTINRPASCQKEDDFEAVAIASLSVGAVLIVSAMAIGIMCMLRAPHHKRKHAKNAESDLVDTKGSRF
jgi:hypothetical protein